MATQAIGVFVAVYYFKNYPVVPATVQFSFTDAIIIVIFLIFFVFLATRNNKASFVIFRIFLWLVIFSGSQAVFGSFLDPLSSLLASLLLLFLTLKISRVFVQNLAVIFGISGISAILGLSLTPLMAVVVLVVLSFYDIVSVYLTGHMVKMAQNMIRAKAVFGLIIPSSFNGFWEKAKDIKPGGNFMILGSGDLALPLVLVTSLVPVSLSRALVVAVFSMVGLFVMHLLFVNQKERRAMAALPPIAVMSIIGYLISAILNF